MSATDRTIALAVTACAVVAWVAVAVVVTSISPIGNPAGPLAGSAVLGAAVGLSACPLFWSFGVRWTDSRSGGWGAAGRRASITGVVVSVVVLLRAIDALAVPVLLFLLSTAALVELAFMVRSRATS